MKRRLNSLIHSLVYSSSGMNPRPLDDYDRLCERYYRCCVAGNVARASVLEQQLLRRDGSSDVRDVLDSAYSHGLSLANHG